MGVKKEEEAVNMGGGSEKKRDNVGKRDGQKERQQEKT